MSTPLFSRFLALGGILLASVAFTPAQTGDAPPVDTAQILKVLKQMREEQNAGLKQRRMSAYNQIVAAASSGEKAVALWKEAAKSVMFEGSDKEVIQVREWRDGEGGALNSKECQNVARLHLQWLALTLQHAHGTDTKKLLPNVLDYVRQLNAANEALDHFTELLNKAKDRDNPATKRMAAEDEVIKKVCDQVLRSSVAGSVVSRWLQLGELLNDGEVKKLKPESGGWELVPGNLDGIYNNIILPEYRLAKDPRLMDYWDMVIKRETDHAAGKKLDVDRRDWSTIKRPSLLWARSQDMLVIGQKNKALGEMFNLIKTFPAHPNADDWIGRLEKVLTTPAEVPSTATTTTETIPTTPKPAGTIPLQPVTTIPKTTVVVPPVKRPVAPTTPPVAVAVEVEEGTVPEGTIPASELGGKPSGGVPAPK